MDLKLFLKENKIEREGRRYRATSSLLDEEGRAIEWVLRPVSTRENEEIRESAVTRSGGEYRFDAELYTARLAAAAVEEPNLYNAQLQDSYGVSCPEDLLREMVDKPGEYSALVREVQDMNGFTSLKEKVEQAKN
ncbi:MAG: hypothetical protein IJR45_01970 [Firmicutes bacterium]|nr:hypothetical protein [Bacillota bacterium]